MEMTGAYVQLRTEILRVLDGSAHPTSLQGWCLHAYPHRGEDTDDISRRLWQHTMRTLVVYAQCDLERWMLETSLRLLLRSFEECGDGCLTPVTLCPCYRKLLHQGQLGTVHRLSTPLKEIA